MKPRRAVVVIAIALGVSGGMAGPAMADPDVCESGEMCLFENTDFNQGNTPNQRQWPGNDDNYTDNTWWNAAGNYWTNDVLDNEASSVSNNGNECPVTLHQDTNYGGSSTTFFLGTSDGYLGNDNIGDNRASAHSWC